MVYKINHSGQFKLLAKTFSAFQIESADGEFKMATDFRKISTNSYGFSPKAGIVNSLPVKMNKNKLIVALFTSKKMPVQEVER